MLIELQNSILEMIARGQTLRETVDRLCVAVERHVPGIACSVLTVDGDGCLHPLSGPSLPSSYNALIDGLSIGPLVGSCGTAAFTEKPVTVTDIETDPRWEDYKAYALPHGLRACWSTPICSSERVTGTFAFYYREKRGPSAVEQEIVDACVHLCAIAIERDERVQERQRLTYTDAMTGLPNRARFNKTLAELDTEPPRDWGMLLVDIDNLKMVNDTFGHHAGDDLIKTVATRVAAVAANAATFRLGGDEFAIFVYGEAGDSLATIADRILAALKQPSDCGGHVVFPMATIGGAGRQGSDDPETVRQNADFALYHAKENFRGRYVEYSPGLGTAITNRFRAIRDVNLALTEDRIDAFYQPIVRLDRGEIVGFEALCRMTTAEGKVVSAAHFHEATKDAHVAAQMTERMLMRVAADVRRWLTLGIPFQHVGINLSAADFHSGDLTKRLCDVFEATGVPLKHFILEVTESVYLGQRDHVVADEIQALRAKGLRVALDDFGTGFASLTHLLTVPVDIIKIDKSFIDRLAPGEAGTIIVEGLLGIARKLGLAVIAEGIETAAQARQLLAFGATLGQGYYFSEAVDRDVATNLLMRFARDYPLLGDEGTPQATRSDPVRRAS